MNVKEIVTFISICVVLPNELYSIYNDPAGVESCRRDLENIWMPKTQRGRVFKVDDQGNVLMRLVVTRGATNTSIFVPKEKGIGIYLAVPKKAVEKKATAKLISYLSELFGVPKDDIQIASGFNSSTKIMKLTHGCITKEDALNKIIDSVLDIE